MTLRQFVKQAGGQEKAAATLKIAFSTISRWLNKHTRPSPMALERLEEHGVTKVA